MEPRRIHQVRRGLRRTPTDSTWVRRGSNLVWGTFKVHFWWTRVHKSTKMEVCRGLHLGETKADPPSPPRTPTDSDKLHVGPTRLQLSLVHFRSPLLVDSSPQVHQNGISPPRSSKSVANFVQVFCRCRLYKLSELRGVEWVGYVYILYFFYKKLDYTYSNSIIWS